MENLELLTQYIHPELVVLVVILYVIGISIKKSKYISDEFIPFILGGISIALCAIYILSVNDVPKSYQTVLSLIFDIIVQGVCCSGAAVYFNQLVKQMTKLKLTDGVKHVEETKE